MALGARRSIVARSAGVGHGNNCALGGGVGSLPSRGGRVPKRPVGPNSPPSNLKGSTMQRNHRSLLFALGVLLAIPFTALCGAGAGTDPSASVEGVWIDRYVDHLQSRTMIFIFSKQRGGSL